MLMISNSINDLLILLIRILNLKLTRRHCPFDLKCFPFLPINFWRFFIKKKVKSNQKSCQFITYLMPVGCIRYLLRASFVFSTNQGGDAEVFENRRFDLKNSENPLKEEEETWKIKRFKKRTRGTKRKYEKFQFCMKNATIFDSWRLIQGQNYCKILKLSRLELTQCFFFCFILFFLLFFLIQTVFFFSYNSQIGFSTIKSPFLRLDAIIQIYKQESFKFSIEMLFLNENSGIKCIGIVSWLMRADWL